MLISNGQFRARARAVLKSGWQVAMLVGFIATIPSLIRLVAEHFLDGSLMDRLFNAMSDATILQLSSSTWLVTTALGLIDARLIISWIISLICFLGAPVLTVGMYAQQQAMLEGRETAVSDAFSRVGIWSKAVLTNLLVILRSLVWFLPGLGVYALALVLYSNSQGSYLAAYLADAGFILGVVLAVRCYLRYGMSLFILARKPETGIMEAQRRSKTMMQGKLGAYFFLVFSFLWMLLLAMLLDTYLESWIGAVAGSTIFMILQVIIQVYQSTACNAFYLALEVPEAPVNENPAEKEVL